MTLNDRLLRDFGATQHEQTASSAIASECGL
jgi:hypothetical protein